VDDVELALGGAGLPIPACFLAPVELVQRAVKPYHDDIHAAPLLQDVRQSPRLGQDMVGNNAVTCLDHSGDRPVISLPGPPEQRLQLKSRQILASTHGVEGVDRHVEPPLVEHLQQLTCQA